MTQSYAVELKDVIKSFGSVTAVNNINLQIRDGEFFSLLGPSGCGKTTTLRMIAGFELPTSGELYIGGEQQGYLPPFKRPVNTVFQHYALFPHMTVYQNVAFGLQMQHVEENELKTRVGEALELVHLTGMEKRKPKQLSGGQQQRVALARALVNHPKVLLLDEPLGALDLKLRKAMQVELKALQEQVGITFVYVTHDQEEALTMSDRIGVMNQGNLLQVGSALEVYEQPFTRFVSDFIGETNYLNGTVSAVTGDQLEIAIGPELTVKAPAREGIATGNSVSISVRPEKIRVNGSPGAGENHAIGLVSEIVYMGSITEYHLKLSGDNLIRVRQQNDEVETAQRIADGDRIEIVWAAKAGRVFREED